MALVANAKLYEACADELVQRILVLIPDHPSILGMDDPWGLFRIADFDCKDLAPSMFQASWALGKAKQLYEKH